MAYNEQKTRFFDVKYVIVSEDEVAPASTSRTARAKKGTVG